MKKFALISMLALLACGSVFAKGKKDKAEAEETVESVKIIESEKTPTENTAEPDIEFAK